MKRFGMTVLALGFSAPVLAQETRQMDAHVHGESQLEIAIEDQLVELDLVSPGMDIVGFEHLPASAEDKDAVAAAIASLSDTAKVISLPRDAGCRLAAIEVHLHGDDEGHEHGHHDDHEKHGHDDEHHGHDHDEHEGEHDHAAHDHEEGARHSEFHASYAFACDHAEKVTSLSLPFFETFPAAGKINAQFVTDAGAGVASAARDSGDLTLKQE